MNNNKKDDSVTCTNRQVRLAKRRLKSTAQRSEAECDSETMDTSEEQPNDVEPMDVEITTEQSSDERTETTNEDSGEQEDKVDQEVQCLLLRPRDTRYSIDNYKDDAEALQYYTSFDNYKHFMLFFNILGPAAYELPQFSSLPDPRDQLFLTLCKLRQAKDDKELKIMFKISKTTVGDIFNTWVNFLYFQLKEINIWPGKDVIEEHMPKDFGRKFPKTKVIFDGTETPIEKPSHVKAQRASFSTYKNKNTCKTVIGCSSRGAVMYISDAYLGSASDRQIIERSSLVHDGDLFSPGDSIMADRGIMVQDLFAPKDVLVNTPHVMRGANQFEPETVVGDRRVASKRIHVERVIGLGKTFKILKKPMPHSKVRMVGRITYICMMINNFRAAIVDKYA